MMLKNEDKFNLLSNFTAGAYRAIYEIYRQGDEKMKAMVLTALSESMEGIEEIIDLLGGDRSPKGVAQAMMLTEDIIGCEPKGVLLAADENEAIRRVDQCPWSEIYSSDGGTCKLIMKALECAIGEKYELSIVCEKTLAEGSDCCIWKVKKEAKKGTDRE
ncbi:hypothetical protein [Desulfocicer niacini]